MENDSISMKIINPKAAGIDIGSRSHWVAIGQEDKDVREFGVFNEDLYDLAQWLTENQIRQLPWRVQAHTGKTFMQCSWPRDLK